MAAKKISVLVLALCLLAGCWAAEIPGVPESPSAPPPEISRSEDILPQEDPEHPGNLAGAILYYAPGNRLTLYAIRPGTGAIRTVREEDFWNGREVESVSPSGNRLLLYSWDGAPGRSMVALSLYEMAEDRLVNLSREEDREGYWSEKHWFPGGSTYRFTDEDTFCYRELCYCEDYGQPHLHRYHIGAEGRVTGDALELECPPRRQGRGSSLLLMPEEGKILCRVWSPLLAEENRWEWFTWDLESGKVLSRTPGNNGRAGGYFDNGVFYCIEEDPQTESFRLMACHIDTDTAEPLADGVIPRTPGRENEPWDSRGVLENVRVEGVRDGKILLRSSGEEYGYTSPSLYRELLWDPAAGGEIRFGEPVTAPAFPVDDALGYIPVFTVSPEGEGLYLPLPPGMAEKYREDDGRPYPLARLSTGELLFLAKTADIS